ncbi:hypothetical protein M758_8G173900 [Ceratodon purpureus]|nr:hypothetical protein M758_8G173900 [Ceratodon purpureus]
MSAGTPPKFQPCRPRRQDSESVHLVLVLAGASGHCQVCQSYGFSSLYGLGFHVRSCCVCLGDFGVILGWFDGDLASKVRLLGYVGMMGVGMSLHVFFFFFFGWDEFEEWGVGC